MRCFLPVMDINNNDKLVQVYKDLETYLTTPFFQFENF